MLTSHFQSHVSSSTSLSLWFQSKIALKGLKIQNVFIKGPLGFLTCAVFDAFSSKHCEKDSAVKFKSFIVLEYPPVVGWHTFTCLKCGLTRPIGWSDASTDASGLIFWPEKWRFGCKSVNKYLLWRSVLSQKTEKPRPRHLLSPTSQVYYNKRNYAAVLTSLCVCPNVAWMHPASSKRQN